MAGSRDQSAPRRVLAFGRLVIEARRGDGYPPYDIERLPDGAGVRLRLTIAVAGFDASELDIQIAGGELVIRGRHEDRGEADYLFRGIAARQFQRTFLLPPGADVASARLSRGLLAIELVEPDHVETVRKINISRSK
ncbi:Hsp20 family protein [Ciceribacter sp. L1K23]|nr:Hsp20 family protein [Ciceribacter sp. L1K23]